MPVRPTPNIGREGARERGRDGIGREEKRRNASRTEDFGRRRSYAGNTGADSHPIISGCRAIYGSTQQVRVGGKNHLPRHSPADDDSDHAVGCPFVCLLADLLVGLVGSLAVEYTHRSYRSGCR